MRIVLLVLLFVGSLAVVILGPRDWSSAGVDGLGAFCFIGVSHWLARRDDDLGRDARFRRRRNALLWTVLGLVVAAFLVVKLVR